MKHYFNIADHLVVVDFLEENETSGVHLLPSFEPFRINKGIGRCSYTCRTDISGFSDADVTPLCAQEPPMLTFTVDLTLRPFPKDRRQRVRKFSTGNGETVVDRLYEGGYQFVIRDINNNDCALLISNADFSQCRCNIVGNYSSLRFGLNNALMLAYAYAGSFHDTLLIHASLVRHKGIGYAFTAKSGTGKSTQVANWLRVIPDCDLMNDDNPVIRIIDGKAMVYGSPWSGKTPCYRPTQAPLGAVTKINRAKNDKVERLSPFTSFGTVLPACSAMKWDHAVYSHICDTVTALVSCVPTYVLHCTPAPESAVICKKAIADENE
ncbi:MAG: hypothetical protein NC116_07730 [Clostridium sp.]|nr:hypothetical protein [Clostridium sp.]